MLVQRKGTAPGQGSKCECRNIKLSTNKIYQLIFEFYFFIYGNSFFPLHFSSFSVTNHYYLQTATYLRRCQELALIGASNKSGPDTITDQLQPCGARVDYTSLTNLSKTAKEDAQLFNARNSILSWSFPGQPEPLPVEDFQRTNLLKAILGVGPTKDGPEDKINTVEDVTWGELVTELTPWWSY